MRPFLTVISITLAALPALAQPQSAPVEATPPPVTYEFTPESIQGGTQRPEHEVVEGHVRRRLPSLVRVRIDFRAELLQSAEML